MEYIEKHAPKVLTQTLWVKPPAWIALQDIAVQTALKRHAKQVLIQKQMLQAAQHAQKDIIAQGQATNYYAKEQITNHRPVNQAV